MLRLRLLLCLPLCLLMAPDRLPPMRPVESSVLALAPKDDGHALPDEAAMAQLAQTDPIQFLEWCLIRYDRDVTGYRTVLKKHERIKGTLNPEEEIHVAFREKPFAVLFVYPKDPRPARRVLFPDEKDRHKVVALPRPGIESVLGLIAVDSRSDKAMETTRYPMSEFGIKIGTQRTLGPWKAARKENALHIEFRGEQKIKELGGRPCWVLKRTHYREPEDDGVAELTIYIDKVTWLQTGSILKNKDGGLVGTYFFCDVELNPTFDADTFTRKALKE